jgi:hypothetical protein
MRSPLLGWPQACSTSASGTARAFTWKVPSVAQLQARTAESLSTLTDKLAPAEQRRLQALLARMVDAGQTAASSGSST